VPVSLLANKPAIAVLFQRSLIKPNAIRIGRWQVRLDASALAQEAPHRVALSKAGLQSKSEAAKLKLTGTLAGVPDLIIIARSGCVSWS
jgi:hypothetical protein